MPFLDARRLTMLIFFLQPIAFGSWLPRIPEVQHMLGLGPAGLAIALLGLPCGTLLTLPFAGRIVGRIGARRAILTGFPLYSLIVLLPVLAPNPQMLFVALLLCGSSISFLELGLNVEADQVEKSSGRLLMNTCHGFWSLGIMAGSLVGALLGGAALPPGVSVPLVSLIVLPIALLIAMRLPGGTPERAPAKSGGGIAWPSRALLGICFFVFGVTMTEGAMADWSAIFMRDIMQADTAAAGLAYSVFALLVAGGRFAGDWLKARFTAVPVARFCGALAILGIVLLYFAPSYPLALAAFALVGLGVSIGFPIAVSAAASLTDRPAASSVAVLSFIALVGFLVGPPLIGLIAELGNIRLGLVALLPFLVLSLALTGMLIPRGRTSLPTEAQTAGAA
ncbi:MAG TPA: MFS transporter [Devosia sp.]|nr:MFS transporter [Devosia sp.]